MLKFIGGILTLLVSVFGSQNIHGSPFAGWAGSGGKFFGDEQNPWFLENTTKVHYCIVADVENFGVSLSVLKREVGLAIRDWQVNLQKANRGLEYYQDDFLEPFDQVRVGTQEFIEVNCKGTLKPDIKFQFGILDEQQEKLFANAKDFVAMAMRTHYDRVNLKGKGFLYFAPVKGPLAPNRQELMHPQAWSQNKFLALKTIMRHELGHVFGVGHQPSTIMSEKLPAVLVNAGLDFLADAGAVEYFESAFTIDRFLGVKENGAIEACDNRNPIFGAHIFQREWTEGSCGKVQFKENSIYLYFKANKEDEFEQIGEIQLGSGHSTMTRPLINVFFTKKQKVFTKIPKEAEIFQTLYGTEQVEARERQGVLKNLIDGKSYPFKISLRPEGTRNLIFKDNRFESLIFSL